MRPYGGDVHEGRGDGESGGWKSSLFCGRNRTSVLFHGYDTTLRAVEIEADVILLAKAVDGVYDSDPKLNPDAKKYDEISIQSVIDQKLGVMDLTASIMCMENRMPMLVFGLNEEDSIVNTVNGKFTGTKIMV